MFPFFSLNSRSLCRIAGDIVLKSWSSRETSTDMMLLYSWKLSIRILISILSYRTYQKPSHGFSRGFAIAVRKNYDFNIISGFCGLDGGFDGEFVLGIRITNLSINFNIISVYRRLGGSLRVNDFRALTPF